MPPQSITRITLMRHGETLWNVQQRMQGHADIELNDMGRTQAAEAAQTLVNAGIDRIITSNLGRAAETGRIVNTLLNVPISIDERLREIHVGDYQGKTGAEVRAIQPDFFDPYHTEGYFDMGFPNGETYRQVGARAALALNEFVAQYPRQHILVVSHGGTIRNVVFNLLGVTDRPLLHNCCLTRLHHNSETWQLVGYAQLATAIQWDE